MAGWLSRATSLFQQPPPPPEPFEVECDCGRKLTGQRSSAYQKPTCPVCERPVFVLPANVYPRQKSKSKSPIPSPKSDPSNDPQKSSRASTNEVVDDNPAPEPLPKSSAAKKAAPGSTRKPSAIADEALLREPPRRLITPLRLVSVGIVLVIALTIGGLWRRNRIENAKAIVTKATDAGREALKDRDYIVAAVEFDRARRAVDILGRTDDAANAIRQSSREATALANLCTSTLTECVEETLANSKPHHADSLRISSAIQGSWIIFDANLSSLSAGKTRCAVDAPIVLKDGTVQIEIDSPQIRAALQAEEGNEAPRVIFAAQLEQISPFKGDPPVSTMTLNGKTAFLWTNYDSYYSIGFRPIDQENEKETRALLERQNR